MIATRTEPPGDRTRDRLFVATPATGPGWPFLPLVRRHDGGEDLGLLFDARGACDLCGYSATVFLTNLFAVPVHLDQLLALPKEVFDTGEELLQSGWRVD